MASPKTTREAEVMRTPIAEKISIVGGRPMDWPTICCFCPLAKRVKLGMLSESVAQKPTIPVSEGMKILKKEPKSLNLLGWERRGPKPLAAVTIQITRTRARMMTREPPSSRIRGPLPCRCR